MEGACDVFPRVGEWVTQRDKVWGLLCSLLPGFIQVREKLFYSSSGISQGICKKSGSFYILNKLQKGQGIFHEVREKWISSNYNSEKHKFHGHEYVENVYCHWFQCKSILTALIHISLLGCRKPLIKFEYHSHILNAHICTYFRQGIKTKC